MQLSIYLDDKIVKKIEQRAVLEKRSRSNLIQKLLTDIVEKDQGPLVHEGEKMIERKAVDTGISDLASEHDHYLYGTPKKNS